MSQLVGLYKIDVNIHNDKDYPHVTYLYKHLCTVRKHDTLASVHSDRGVVDIFVVKIKFYQADKKFQWVANFETFWKK